MTSATGRRRRPAARAQEQRVGAQPHADDQRRQRASPRCPAANGPVSSGMPSTLGDGRREARSGWGPTTAPMRGRPDHRGERAGPGLGGGEVGGGVPRAAVGGRASAPSIAAPTSSSAMEPTTPATTASTAPAAPIGSRVASPTRRPRRDISRARRYAARRRRAPGTSGPARPAPPSPRSRVASRDAVAMPIVMPSARPPGRPPGCRRVRRWTAATSTGRRWCVTARAAAAPGPATPRPRPAWAARRRPVPRRRSGRRARR